MDWDTQTTDDARGRTLVARPLAPALRRTAQERRVADIAAYIDRHLDDSDLSAARCARALNISVRSLHLALTISPHSFRELMIEKRLERCRVLLQAHSHHDGVADLAFACGFSSLSTFYRTFSKRFNTRPTCIGRLSSLAA